MTYPKPGSVVKIIINGKPKEGVVGGYNYGLSGNETSFYFDDLPSQRFDIEFMHDEGFRVISEPIEDEEEV